jgi:hypothetical protein
MKTEFNKNEKLSTEQETPPIANVLLGEVAFSSGQTTHKVMVTANGFKMRWYATVIKNEAVKYVNEVWCADNYQDEYRKLKKSVKKKIRKLVEDAVSNLA